MIAAGIGDSEFWARHDAELESELTPPPSPASTARELIERPGASGVATVAALASAGRTVLVLCADAIRRRELIERAARPARFGGGELALVSARLADSGCAAASARVIAAGSGVALADWAALERDPRLAPQFEHVVVVDPPPSARLESLATAGDGYLHRVDGAAEREFALRVHAEEWPSRAGLAAVYRGLGPGAGPRRASEARALLCGGGRAHPFTPEVAGRSSRVLAELGLLRWDTTAATRTLSVVSSEATDLDRSAAFVAYRGRYEEGRRYLSERRQT